MKYTTPCFVRIDNYDTRKDLVKWLLYIGYDIYPDPEEKIIIASDSNIFIKDCIDCGENIELFKALAAMNDDNDYMQWHIDKYGNWELHKYIFFDDIIKITCKWRKATDIEIIEHFKTKQI